MPLPKRPQSSTTASPHSETERKALENKVSASARIGIAPAGGKNESRIDPRITALIQKAQPGQRLRVVVKLSTATNGYGLIAPSNEDGNERARVFATEVDELVGTGGGVQVLRRAANLGVATLEGPIDALKDVVVSPRLAGAKLIPSKCR